MPLGNKWLSLVAYVSMAGGIVSLLVIPRLYAVTNGRVMIHGHDVREVTLHSLRGNVGIVLQDSFAFASSISDNIGYGLDNPPIEDVIAAAKVAQFHDFVSRLPDGYDTKILERGSDLSVGQRQLISFARALVADSLILILDEATANIDTESEIIIQEALRKLLKDRTALVVAHRLSTLRSANRIVALENGKIVEQGTHDQLVANEGL